VKVLGVGVTVEVGLHGVENYILWEWYGGWSGGGIGRGFGDAVDVGSDLGGEKESTLSAPPPAFNPPEHKKKPEEVIHQ
jgi:hypothetical protein